MHSEVEVGPTLVTKIPYVCMVANYHLYENWSFLHCATENGLFVISATSLDRLGMNSH